MNFIKLFSMLPLTVCIATTYAGEVRSFKTGEIPDPSVIARILLGNKGTATTPKKLKTRAIMMKTGRSDRGIEFNSQNQAPNANTLATEQSSTSAVESEPSAFSLPIQFGFNSARILPESVPQLNAVGAGIKQAGISVVVEGHTDAAGSDTNNMRLSKKRANAVKQFLVLKHQISEVNLIVEGKGETEPLDLSNPLSPENRRVQFRAAE